MGMLKISCSRPQEIFNLFKTDVHLDFARVGGFHRQEESL
jgi:hypothetical protein